MTGYEWRAKCTPNVWNQDSTKLPFVTEAKAAADAIRHNWGPDKFVIRQVGNESQQPSSDAKDGSR